MDHNSFKTFSAKPGEVESKWWVLDATDLIVGRVATEVASLIRGKHKPQFTPHVDTGDHVIIINAGKVKLSGAKEDVKEYFTYSGFPGGDKYKKFRDLKRNDPEYILKRAVRGMLPKNRLGDKLINKLKVYSGAEHEHQAQQPEAFVVKKVGVK